MYNQKKLKYQQTKVLSCQNLKFKKQDCSLAQLHRFPYESSSGARRVNVDITEITPQDIDFFKILYGREIHVS